MIYKLVMNKKISASLIIATYNWPEALELVLLSVLSQTVLPDEVIIADDGSRNDTKILIEKYKPVFSIPLIHIWQEDIGFRKTVIMNKALKLAKGDYIIQIDGDIIIHKNFIENHISLARPNTFIHGSRALLNKEETKRAFENKKINYSVFNKNIKNKLNAIYFPLWSRLVQSKSANLKKTRGCNFSCWKKDIFKVNGYNEEMIGWGLEDTELAARFINNGILKRQIKFAAVQYHLEHKTSPRDKFNVNNEILTNTIENNIKTTEKGILKVHEAGNSK